MYFDTHAHYDDERYDEDRDELLNELKNKGVEYIVNIGADMNSSFASVELSKKYPFVYASVGVNPHEAKTVCDKDYKTLEELLTLDKVVALGEIGLDYYYDLSDREIQKEVFKNQLKICENVTKPVIIHSREATKDTLDIIKASNVRKGVVHAFSGSLEVAKEYIEMGFYIGIGGVLTFKNANTLVNVVKNIPLDNILIETDAPYLTPVPYRGTRNNSAYLSYVVEKIAEIKSIDKEIVEKTTFSNAKKFFCIN